jgi:signal transduction histidine kinase/CheY-like chemotaxis protein
MKDCPSSPHTETLSGTSLSEKDLFQFTLAHFEATHELHNTLRLQEVLDRTLVQIGKIVPHENANLMLTFNGLARIVACQNYDESNTELIKNLKWIVKEESLLQIMMSTGKPIIIPDIQLSEFQVPLKIPTTNRSFISTTIRRTGKTIGFLSLYSSVPNFYQEYHANQLEIFAIHASMAIENAIIYENARKEIAERKNAEKTIQEHLNQLEIRVQQRTSELLEINQQLTHELTLRNQAETALHAERERLALRIEERTAELSVANTELARTARMKDAFLASMSHELRTPLNAILNVSESLQEFVYGELTDAQKKSVGIIEDSGRHLLSLINDILDISKIGAGKFELMCDIVPVKALCESSIKLIENAARKKQLIIDTAIDPKIKTMWGDQRRLKQVLVNLLSNAVKFTPPGGAVGVMVREDDEKQQIQFVVWDTGIGIPEESIKLLFKPFVQLDNSLARQFEGTGLGLALAYHIIELHGGGISVQSEIGKGSQFIVTFSKKDVYGFNSEKAPAGEGKENPMDPSAVTPAVDPLPLIGRYLKELGIEPQTEWLLRGTRPTNITFPSNEILVIDANLMAKRDNIRESMQMMGGDYFWPVILVVNRQEDDLMTSNELPRNIGALCPPFTRKDLRTLIKRLSPDGTASLINRATIYREREIIHYSKQPMILIADDNESSRRIFLDYLSVKGYRVSLACDGAEAIGRARELVPDMILMDIQMPGIDGLEAITRIRADKQIKHIPIIALTALAMPSDRALCLNAGANGYLSKPISLDELVIAIQKQLSGL